MSVVTKSAASADAKQVKRNIDVLMNGTARLLNVLQTRFDAISKQARPKQPPKTTPSPPKLSPVKPFKPTKRPKKKAGDDSQKKRVSSISAGIAKAPSELAPKHRLHNKTYSEPHDDLSLEKAARAITR